MILVTLGTQDKPFTRLLEAIQKEIDLGHIKDKVVVQAGCTHFDSKDMELYDLIPMNEFTDMVKKCDLLITHGGVGSIMTGLNYQKPIIAVPRLQCYSEHVNDHQIQIIENFDEEGYILGLIELEDLPKKLKKAKHFIPKTYQSNTKNFIKLIEDYIDHH